MSFSMPCFSGCELIRLIFYGRRFFQLLQHLCLFINHTSSNVYNSIQAFRGTYDCFAVLIFLLKSAFSSLFFVTRGYMFNFPRPNSPFFSLFQALECLIDNYMLTCEEGEILLVH